VSTRDGVSRSRSRSRARWRYRLLLVLLPVLTAAGGIASPAQAAVYGPIPENCTVHGRTIYFSFWLDYPRADGFKVYRVKWRTSFRPSRMAISLNHVNGATPLVRAWGGSASTLHDVGATGDTGPNWGSTTYSTASYLSVYARVYLNANEWC
jgi:hypothetical protein